MNKVQKKILLIIGLAFSLITIIYGMENFSRCRAGSCTDDFIKYLMIILLPAVVIATVSVIAASGKKKE